MNILYLNQCFCHSLDDDSFLVMTYPTTDHLYATIPFNMTCTGTLLTDNQFRLEINWYRDDTELISSTSDNSLLDISILSYFINSTTVKSSLMITEPLPVLNVEYKCVFTAYKMDTLIHSRKQSTGNIKIQGM